VLIAVALGAVGYFSAALAREYGAPLRSVFTTGWCAAGVLALARLAILYGGPLLFGVNHSRPIGFLLFFLFLANYVFEMRAAGAFLGAPTSLEPSFLIASLIVLTSVPLGFLWAWIRSGPARQGPHDAGVRS
jgi:hypothetical protein